MIKRVKLENWRSHKRTELEFGPGTNVLVGTMGSGKSSVMNAVCFGLFGTFPELQRREAKLEGIIMDRPSREEFARVEIEFEYKDKDYRVERLINRGTKTNTAKFHCGKEFVAGPKVSDVNEAIQSVLELNYDLFSRAVYSEQNQMDFFIRLNAGERKQKFDELLELDKYELVRKNAVSVQNTLKKLLEQKKQFFEEQKSSLKESDIESIRKEIAELNAKIRVKREEKEKAEKTVKELGEDVKNSREKRTKFKELSEKRIAARQAANSLDAEIELIEKEFGKVSGLKESEVEKKIEECDSLEKELRKQEREIAEIEAELRGEKAKNDSLKEENENAEKRLPEKISSHEDLKRESEIIRTKIDAVEKKKKELKERLVALREAEQKLGEKVKVNEAKEKEEKTSMELLGKKEPHCPLCKSELSEKSRAELAENAEKEIERLALDSEKARKESIEISGNVKEFEREIEEQEGEINTLMSVKALLSEQKKILDRIQENEEKVKKAEAKIKELNGKKAKLEAKGIAKKIEDCTKEKEIAKKQLEGIQKAVEAEKKKLELNETEKKLVELNFDEEKAISSERELEKLSEKLNSFDSEIRGIIELIGEKKKREEEIKEKKELLEKTAERVKTMEFALSKLAIFINSLKATQAELRESLVETINAAMDTVWPRLYPYRDFVSAKMEIDSGNYDLMVQAHNGKWQKIEGVLSGGERSAVALTLRIAFSLVLARNLGMLILDEPTHNLDSKAVEKLGDMMHEHLSGMVDQVFLITHNKQMEKAASAALYVLSRDKEKQGMTRAELLTVRD